MLQRRRFHHSPLSQSVMQYRVIAPQHDGQIYPSFREERWVVVVKNVALSLALAVTQALTSLRGPIDGINDFLEVIQ